jgi:hypothetical protein
VAFEEYFRQPVVDTFDSRIIIAIPVKHSIDLYLRDVKYNSDERKWLVIPENNQNFIEFMKLKPEKKYLNFFYKREASY